MKYTISIYFCNIHFSGGFKKFSEKNVFNNTNIRKFEKYIHIISKFRKYIKYIFDNSKNTYFENFENIKRKIRKRLNIFENKKHIFRIIEKYFNIFQKLIKIFIRKIEKY